MATKFFPAPEVERIGRELIKQHRKHLLVHGIRVDFIFRDGAPQKSGGNEVWGTARKISGFNAFLSNYNEDTESADDYFLITISSEKWELLDEEQRVALVDHELMHCGTTIDENDDIQLILIGHDFEGFNAEIERYGLWRPNAHALGIAMRPHLQLSMFNERKAA